MTDKSEKAWAAWSKAASPEDLRYFEEVGDFPVCTHCGHLMHFQTSPLDKGLCVCTNCDAGDQIAFTETLDPTAALERRIEQLEQELAGRSN